MKALKIVQIVLLILLIFVLVGGLISFAMGGLSFDNFPTSENSIELLNKTEDAKNIKDIKVDMISGDINLTQSDADEIKVVYTAPESVQKKIEFTVTVENDQLVIRQKRLNNSWLSFFSWFSGPVKVDVTIPRAYADSINLNSVSGDMLLSGIYEFTTFKASSVSGDFSADSVTANKLDISRTSGEIEADTLAGDGQISVVSGDVDITNLIGKVDISSTSGGITIDSLSGQGSAHTVSGDVKIGVVQSTGDLDLNTTSGEIRVGFDKKVAFLIDASCNTGDISADFPLTFEGNRRHNATGTFGENPTAKLTAGTVSGDITFKTNTKT